MITYTCRGRQLLPSFLRGPLSGLIIKLAYQRLTRENKVNIMCMGARASQVAQWERIYLPMAGDTGDVGSIPGSGRSPGEGHDLPGSESVFGISQDLPMCEHLSAKMFCTEEAYG